MRRTQVCVCACVCVCVGGGGGVKAKFHLTGTDRIGTKEDIPLVEIDVI